MEATSSRHPVLHCLAVTRAARDFGLRAGDVDTLTSGFRPGVDSLEALADAFTTAVIGRREVELLTRCTG
jgi:hypothetical protein